MKTEDDEVREALVAVGMGPAAKELYVDLLRPTAREMGANLLVAARLISVAMAPLQGLVWGLEKIRDWLSAALLKRLAKEKPEDIQPPPTYIAGQILLQLPFCAEEEQLREMYANLLAAAMLKRTSDRIHPAFVQVIQQLTPDEALILQRIAREARRFSFGEARNSRGARISGSSSIVKFFQVYCEGAGVSNPDLSETYLDNLLRLKLLDENRAAHSEVKHSALVPNESRVENVNVRNIRLSSFGSQFIVTCVLPGLSAQPNI